MSGLCRAAQFSGQKRRFSEVSGFAAWWQPSHSTTFHCALAEGYFLQERLGRGGPICTIRLVATGIQLSTGNCAAEMHLASAFLPLTQSRREIYVLRKSS